MLFLILIVKYIFRFRFRPKWQVFFVFAYFSAKKENLFFGYFYFTAEKVKFIFGRPLLCTIEIVARFYTVQYEHTKRDVVLCAFVFVPTTFLPRIDKIG